MALFRGAGVALVTPFHTDESIDYGTLGAMIERQIEGGTDALIVCGTTGEPVTMTEEERLSVIRYAVAAVGGRIPVIAGSGCNNTRAAAEFAKKAEAEGADGLLVVTPYYNKATQQGLYEHYKTVASAVSLPIILYNVPSRTGCNLLPETAARLGRDVENIVAVKEACGNISQVAKLARLAEGTLDIYSGNDDQIIPILALGGIGVISVLSNVAPRNTHDMVAEYLAGNRERALALQLRYLELIDALFCEVSPIPVKYALRLLGLGTGTLRLPLTELSAEHKKTLAEAMRGVGLLEG